MVGDEASEGRITRQGSDGTAAAAAVGGAAALRSARTADHWQSAMRRLMTVRIVCQPSVELGRTGSSMNWYVVQPSPSQA
jgi:hypothetical protein